MQPDIATDLETLTVPPDAVYLPGDPRAYPTFCYAHGGDIIVPLAWATAFGGANDTGDDGSTASGIRTDGVPPLACCALPLAYDHACRGTPLPTLPWGTLVRVQSHGRAISVPLQDVGPARALPSKAFIDLTMPAWRLLKGSPGLGDEYVDDLGDWVSIVIPGGMAFLKDYVPAGVNVGTAE